MTLRQSREVITGRLDAVRADQTANLKEQRVEGREEDRPESAEEQPAQPQVSRSRARPGAKEPLRNRRKPWRHRTILQVPQRTFATGALAADAGSKDSAPGFLAAARSVLQYAEKESRPIAGGPAWYGTTIRSMCYSISWSAVNGAMD